MSAISKTYQPQEVETKWYSHWQKQGFFHAEPSPDKEPYCIVIPPPNVTGVLHMGHMLNNTIQDVLVRRARMQGKAACWVPGTDHASIATEAKVVAMLREKGIKKSDLSRDGFLTHAWEWKEKYGGIILEQLKKLGASCDWDRTRFTMDPDLSAAVVEVFVKLHTDGLIYRGHRMVNWDPQGKTALSDEEVIHKEVNSKLYHLKYFIVDKPGDAIKEDNFIIIATTRPETILGDTAVCVNPKDERYTKLKGKFAIVPLANRAVPVIQDEYVDIEFGTGCLKVTPAHDMNDYMLGQKHNLEVLDIMNDDGTLSEKAGMYIGEDRFVVRKKISKELEAQGLLTETKDLKNSVGYSERTDAVIEPRLSLQWFVDMKKFMEKHPEVLTSVMNDEIVLYPAKFKNTYRHWIENIKDWCISRQLWWGQRIPAYYLADGQYVVAETDEKALAKARALSGNASLQLTDLRQDEDVLDTWFSSWLWPISVFDGFKNPNNEDIKYFYPTNDLVTAPEILFFWVARMIMAGYAFRGEKPFTNVYLTGIVRDKQGRKMSKSLGNSPDPLDLIKQFGADGVRIGMLFSSPAGNDLLFDDKLCEQGRNFSNKIWNAFRLIKGWNIVDTAQPESNKASIEWFKARFNESLIEIEEHFDKYRLSDALMSAYKLVWDDFCSWYLEMIKPGFEQPIDRATYNATLELFEEILKVLHPFMPFITEELWHEMNERSDKDCLIVANWPKTEAINKDVLNSFNDIIDIIKATNSYIQTNGLKREDELELIISTEGTDFSSIKKNDDIIKKLAKSKLNTQYGAALNSDKRYQTVPLSTRVIIYFESKIDPAAEKVKLAEELTYTKGFLQSVMKKLSNERFVSGAPADVLDKERQKQADAEAKIKALEESLAQMN